jgi:hypothetical protein
LQACARRGLTEDMIMQNPMVLKDILYSMDMTDVLKNGIFHDFS